MRKVLASLASATLLTSLVFAGLAPSPAQADEQPKGSAGVILKKGDIKPPPPAAPGVKGKTAKPGTKPVVAIGETKKAPMPDPEAVSTRGLTPCVPDCHLYTAVGDNNFGADPFEGAEYFMSIQKPYHAEGATSPYLNNNMGQHGGFSLNEMGVRKQSTGGNFNDIEIGSIVAPRLNGGSTDPHMFVFNWIDGVPDGYNLTGTFVDLSGQVGLSPVGPGDSLAADIGTSQRFSIHWFDNATSGNREGWWIGYKNLWVGYYPNSTYVNAGESFTDGTVATAFGEIASFGMESCDDMGTGVLPSAGVGATISSFAVSGTTITPNITDYKVITTPTRWDLIGTTSPIYFGGPGWNAPGKGHGYTGSCGPPAQGTPCDRAVQFWQSHAPDNTTVGALGGTGAENMVCYSRASLTIGTCIVPLNQGIRPIYATWNNALQSGYTYKVYKTNNCTGTDKTYGNGQKEAYAAGSGWEDYAISSFKRTA
jgi:hypothetical protein